MRLPPATLLAGVTRTLEEDVLPAVGDRAAPARARRAAAGARGRRRAAGPARGRPAPRGHGGRRAAAAPRRRAPTPPRRGAPAPAPPPPPPARPAEAPTDAAHRQPAPGD